MHLHGYPKYYVKDGKRRAVYYTADARDLTASGWRPEEEKQAAATKPAKTTKPAPAPPRVEAPTSAPEPVEKIEVEVVEGPTNEAEPKGTEDLPDFEFMTKPELLEYAMRRGVDLPNNALKAELVKACRELANG
jgi:hypothetical protein